MAAVLRPVFRLLSVAGVALMALYGLAVCTTRGQLLEDTAVLGSDDVHVDPALAQGFMATITDDRAMIIAILLPLILGWWRGTPLAGAVVAATVLAANITTQALKILVFVRPDLVVNPEVGTGNSLPSGSVTFLLSMALAVVLMLPDHARAHPLTVLLPAAAIVAGCATIALDWHRPADVLAGVIVTVAWFAIARSALDRLAVRSTKPDAGTTDHQLLRPVAARPAARDWQPVTRGVLGLALLSLLPLASIAVLPHFAPDVQAHGALVYVCALAVVAVGSFLAVNGLLRCDRPAHNLGNSPAPRPPRGTNGAGGRRPAPQVLTVDDRRARQVM